MEKRPGDHLQTTKLNLEKAWPDLGDWRFPKANERLDRDRARWSDRPEAVNSQAVGLSGAENIPLVELDANAVARNGHAGNILRIAKQAAADNRRTQYIKISGPKEAPARLWIEIV